MMRARTILVLATLILLTTLPVSAARLQPSSDLLLPRFEVDPDSGITTTFSVGNASEKTIEVLATLSTDGGVAILTVPFALQAGEVRSVDLREWLADASGVAVGSMTLRTRSGRRDALWGDWSVVDAGDAGDVGDVGGRALRNGSLVDIDRSGSHSSLCRRHLLRYDAGTEILVWRETASTRLDARVSAAGEPEETLQIGLPALGKVAIADLGLPETSGVLRIDTAEDVYIAGAFCVASSCETRRTGLAVDILLNGRIADEARGPLVDSGSRLDWTLLVTNTGEMPVSRIEIAGLDATCPHAALEPDETLECTAAGTALSNPQSVPVLVTGSSSCADVSAKTTGYYEGVLVDVYP